MLSRLRAVSSSFLKEITPSFGRLYKLTVVPTKRVSVIGTLPSHWQRPISSFSRFPVRSRSRWNFLTLASQLKSSLKRNPDRIIYGIIGLNTAVFLQWQLARFSLETRGDPYLYQFMRKNFTFSLSETLAHGRLWTALTSMFSHASLGHFAVNMLVLWSFGPVVLGMLGPQSFLQLYFMSGLACHAFNSCYEYIRERSRRLVSTPALGASGAILGLTSVFALTNPNATIYLFLVIPVPALWCFIGFTAWDILSGHAGHLGGALYGSAYFFWKLRRQRRW